MFELPEVELLHTAYNQAIEQSQLTLILLCSAKENCGDLSENEAHSFEFLALIFLMILRKRDY